ncbi:MAG: TIGR03546 family protein, partial [Phycisphaeraceae bacterium]
MFWRSFGKILRGKSTPFQISLACILGAMLGFTPTGIPAIGALLFLLALLLILNANLILAAVVLGGCKILSLILAPVLFTIGRILLDGPTQPLFKWAINTPVLALADFRYYTVTGGLAIGLLVGIFLAILVNAVIKSFRVRMAALQNNNEAYAKWSSKAWVQWLSWLLIGGRDPKKGYEAVLNKKIGMPIRPLGVIAAAGIVALVVLVQMFFSEPIVTASLQRNLERANGATVDLDSAQVDLQQGRITITGLAMADPNDLNTDTLRADRAEIAIRGRDFLTKRIGFERTELTGAAHGFERSRPGRLVGPRPTPPPPEPTTPEEKTIDDYLQQADVWKQRLAQIRKWLDRIDTQHPDTAPKDPTVPRETLRERLAREVRQRGYHAVTASHLVEGAPMVAAYEMLAAEIRLRQLEGETVTIDARNISTQPWLLDDAATIKITSSAGKFDFDINLGASARTPGASHLKGNIRRLPIDDFVSGLRFVGDPPMQGGTMDVSIDADITGGLSNLDFPLKVILRNTTLNLPGVGKEAVDELPVTLRIRGPLDNPRITFTETMLADALRAAGKARLAGELEKHTGKVT